MRFSKSSSIQSSESGFSLPIILGMGLIAVLIGLTTVLRAQDDRLIAGNSTNAKQSQLAAEAGITKILSFMNRYRMLAKVDACNDSDWDQYGKCKNSGDEVTDVSWGNPDLLPNLNADCKAEDSIADSRTTVKNWTSNDWKVVDASNPTLGEYRLINYDSEGTLITVEGITGRGETGESRSVISAKIPVFEIDNEQVAGLWVNNSVTSNPVLNTDIVGSCASSVNATLTAGKSVIRTQMQMPSAPSLPAVGPGVYDLRTEGNISGLAGDNFTSGSGESTIYTTGKKLPRLISNGTGTTVDDQPDDLGVYNYIVDSIDDSFEIVPGKAVNIWVVGNIDLRGKRIINPCNVPGAATSCGPFDVRIYGTGSSMNLSSGSAACDIFFHLPGYDVSFNSGGSTSFDCGGGVKNTSLFWVNTWSGADGANTLLAPRATWSQALNATGISALPPRIGAVQVWNPES